MFMTILDCFLFLLLYFIGRVAMNCFGVSLKFLAVTLFVSLLLILFIAHLWLCFVFVDLNICEDIGSCVVKFCESYI